MKREQRHYDRKFRKSKLEIDRQTYTNQYKALYKLLKELTTLLELNSIRLMVKNFFDCLKIWWDIALSLHICRKELSQRFNIDIHYKCIYQWEPCSHFFLLAHMKPLLKKQDLDQETLKNNRPVLNLTFVSKILEKIFCNNSNSIYLLTS